MPIRIRSCGCGCRSDERIADEMNNPRNECATPQDLLIQNVDLPQYDTNGHMQNNAVLARDRQQGHDRNNIGLDLSKLQHHHVEGIMLVCATLELTLMMLTDIADQIFRSIGTFPPH
ncbi:hypothetical protein INT45_000797 [Circinella minor]|uniref:Uncharacterized protein n=1 Tax=Circinella minor TaxID=1195481 RepID=A0A8H7RUT8_9FUNG|nr:hypothetical protein INT45_000797 [Circinella minor]